MNKRYKYILIAGSSLVFLTSSVIAQKTDFPSAHQKLAVKQVTSNDAILNTYSLKHDTLAFNSSNGSIFESSLFYNPEIIQEISSVNCTKIIPKRVEIDSCILINCDSFPVWKTCSGNTVKLIIEHGFSITHCQVKGGLHIENVKCSTQTAVSNVNNNIADYIEFRIGDFNLLNITGNNLDDEFSLSWITANLALIQGNKQNINEKSISLNYSTIKFQLNFLNNNCNIIDLVSDTLHGQISITFNILYSTVKNTNKEIRIRDSYVNAQFSTDIDNKLFKSKLVFEDCSFGSRASLFNLQVDTVVFKNCTNIPFPLFITADKSREKIYLQVINSNVNNIRFDYTDRFKLFFNDVTDETKNSVYQSLLAKFKQEGKPKNIELIDVEYKEYLYANNFLLYPLWALDWAWWYYGYKKWLIVLWTIVFLSIFFLFNFINWDDLRKTYGVFDKDDLSLSGQEYNYKRVLKKSIYVLLFTSFIFFSLRIDFDKLKYTNNKFLVIFFTQYIVGLICLFFLVNAIFKLN